MASEAAPGRATDLSDRLVAEATRLYEAGRREPLDDGQAVDQARAEPGTLEQKIVARAKALPMAEAIADALRQLRGMLRLTLAAGLLLAVISGAAAALAALDAPAGLAVNFHWALLSLLGVETIVLLLWVSLMLLRPGVPEAPSFGLLLAGLSRRLARGVWHGRGKSGDGTSAEAAALQATINLTGRGAVGRWSLGAISHGVWLAFLAGALAMTLVLLSVKQVAFVWQTTILSEESYLPATEALALLPGLAGFPVPSDRDIAASRWQGPDDLPTAASRTWAGLLVGSLVIYGLLPRGLLLAICLLLGRRAARRLRLDLTHPDYLALEERLIPRVRHEGVIERDNKLGEGDGMSSVAEILPIPEIHFTGTVEIIGLEIETPEDGWPPTPNPKDGWRDLGVVDGREDRARVLEEIANAETGLVVVAISLLNTPDRGLGAFLGRLKSAASAPIVLLLSDHARLGQRLSPHAAQQRLADWRGLAESAGLPAGYSLLYDLERPEEADRARLAKLFEMSSGKEEAS